MRRSTATCPPAGLPTRRDTTNKKQATKAITTTERMQSRTPYPLSRFRLNRKNHLPLLTHTAPRLVACWMSCTTGPIS